MKYPENSILIVEAMQKKPLPQGVILPLDFVRESLFSGEHDEEPIVKTARELDAQGKYTIFVCGLSARAGHLAQKFYQVCRGQGRYFPVFKTVMLPFTNAEFQEHLLFDSHYGPVVESALSHLFQTPNLLLRSEPEGKVTV